jgi:hypothetical protein
MENYKVNINEILDQQAEIRAQRADEERELKRPRTIDEAEWLIKVWKNDHGRKTKTPVKISICMEYSMELDRFFYYLRLFVGGNLESKFNLDSFAGETLTQNKDSVVQGGLAFYTIYSNSK